MSDITLTIDTIIEEVLGSLPFSIYKIINKSMGGVDKLYKLEATSPKLKEDNFKILSKNLQRYNQELLNILLNRITLAVRDLMKNYDVDVAMGDFLKEIQATINLNMEGIPNNIRQDVINTVLDSFGDDNINELADRLKTSIGGTISKAKILMSEALTRKVREKNFSIMEKAEQEGDMWLFSHVIDSKNAPFCSDYGNQIKSKKDWINLKSNFFTQGGHFGCRGVPVLVKKEDIDDVKKEVAPLIEEADKLDREK